MKNFTLTLYAKRRSDGTYDYSLNVWENRPTDSFADATNFESQALVTQQLEAVLPVDGDAKFMTPEAASKGEYWFPFTMPMSEEQAANLGWKRESPLENCLVN